MANPLIEDLRMEINDILCGMYETKAESPDGLWETTDGAACGTILMAKINAAFAEWDMG
jgi:hypothetical protein